MSDVFERAFGATNGSIDQSAAVPLGQFPAQAIIAQAGTINAGNASMAAIEDNAAVQRKAANNADTVALEAARLNQATTADVTQILLSGMDAVKTGREQLVSESLAAIEKQKQLSQLQQNKPNPLLHPIQWVADSLHENKLEGQIQDHSKAVQVVNANVTNVVNSTAISANELLSMQNLTTSAAMRTRAAELSQGLEAERATSNANFQKAGVAGKVVQDMYGQSRDLAGFQQQQTRLETDQANAVTARSAAKTQAERLAMELQEKQDFDDSITSAARYDLNLRNIPTTPDNLKAAKFDMIKRYEANDPLIKLYMRGGAVAKNSTGRTAALTASASGMTLGELAQLGTVTGDKSLSKLGQDQFYERTNQYLEQIKLTAFNAQPKGKDGQPVQGRQFWEQALSAADQKAYRAQAEAMARNEVYNQSPMAYLGKKTSNRDVGQSPLNLAAFKTPAMLQQTYKISPEAAKVLSNPQAQLRIHTAGANSSSDRFTSQLVQMMKELDAAKIKNSSGVVAQISGISGKAAIDEDEEAKTLGGMGVVSSGSGIITYKGKPYKLDSAEDLLRMRQVHDKKLVPSVPAFLAGKASDLVGAAWNVGANENPLFAPIHAGGAAAGALVTGLEFERDKASGLARGSNPALPLLIETNERNNYGTGSGGFDSVSPVTPEQAAVAASRFTPVGHAPQVAGGIPATELSEAEKVHLQAEMSRQLAPQREAAAPPPTKVESAIKVEAAPSTKTPVPTPTATYDQGAPAAPYEGVQKFEARKQSAGIARQKAELDAVSRSIGLANLPTYTSPANSLLPSDAPTELKNAVAAPVVKQRETVKAVNIVEEAVKDGSLPKKAAVPIIKAKVQEAKKADEPKAEDKWSSLLDIVTGKVNSAVVGSAWSADPKQQKQYKSGLVHANSTLQPSKDYTVGMMGLLSNDSSVYAPGWQPTGTPIKGLAVKVKNKSTGEEHAVPLSFAEVEAYTGGKLSTTNWAKFTPEDHRRFNRTALDSLKKLTK